MDSELFGHVRGAFTGADQNRTGKLEQALDGTLLLDEIDMLSASAQVKLLQVVEERTFQPVGGTEFQPLRARLIVASNPALKSEVEAKRFRSDLYYPVKRHRIPTATSARTPIGDPAAGVRVRRGILKSSWVSDTRNLARSDVSTSGVRVGRGTFANYETQWNALSSCHRGYASS